jgi:hypothetical protein
LGADFRGAGRIYLVGGTSIVFEKLRQQTLDIDVVIDIEPQALALFIEAVRDLMVELDVNVEEASPGDFIPLPSGYATRHVYVGRFGQLDVYHFDLYSAALSKIARGREQDYQDVLALLKAQRIAWPQLKAYYEEILPQLGLKSLKQDPFQFELNFDALASQWRAAGGHP